MSVLPVPPASDGGARALRLSGHAGPPADGGPTRVLRIDPADGARGVFRDTRVVACLSRAADTRTLCSETFVVFDEEGHVPGGVWTSLDGRIAVWTPSRLLAAGKLHCVRLAGVRDLHGRDVEPHESAFVPCDLSLDEIGP